METTKATLSLLGRAVFTAEAPIEPTPDGAITMSFDLSAARFVAAGPTDLAYRSHARGRAVRSDARRGPHPHEATDAHRADDRGDPPRALRGLHAGGDEPQSGSAQEAQHRQHHRRRPCSACCSQRRSPCWCGGSSAGCLDRRASASPSSLGALGGVAIAIGGVRRGRRRRAERAQARAAARATSARAPV